jgi:hypothetical protein
VSQTDGFDCIEWIEFQVLRERFLVVRDEFNFCRRMIMNDSTRSEEEEGNKQSDSTIKSRVVEQSSKEKRKS